jgi:hypothetical protein
MIIDTGNGDFIGFTPFADLIVGENFHFVACDYWGTGLKWRNVARNFAVNSFTPD